MRQVLADLRERALARPRLRSRVILLAKWFAIAIVIGGSYNDFLALLADLSNMSWVELLGLVLLLSLAAVALYIFRPDLDIAAPVGLPGAMADGDPLSSRVSTLSSRSELVEIAELATRAFGSEAMTFEQIEHLHWHSKDTVFMLRDDDSRAVGYFAVMFPTLQTEERFKNNATTIDDLTSADFLLGDAARERRCIYLESAVVEHYLLGRFLIMARRALEEIAWFFQHADRERDLPIRIYSMAASDQGKNLLVRRLQMQCLIKACDNKAEMDLYFGTRTPAQLEMLRDELERLVDQCLERRLDIRL